MTKTYCDLCGVEIDKDNEFHNGLQAKHTEDLSVDLFAETTLDVCKYCVLDLITSRLDDRLRPA